MPMTAATGLTARDRSSSFDVLDADMTPADIVETLEQMKFRVADQFRTVRLDEQVRDFIVAALRRKP
jgi:hypothetical protein